MMVEIAKIYIKYYMTERYIFGPISYFLRAKELVILYYYNIHSFQKNETLDLNFIHELECKNLIITNIQLLPYLINSLKYFLNINTYTNNNTDEKVHIVQPHLLNLCE